MFMPKYDFDTDDEEQPCNCFICNDKKQHLTDAIQVLPEHITPNIVYFICCKSCLTTFKMIDLSANVEQKHVLKARRQLGINGYRLEKERE